MCDEEQDLFERLCKHEDSAWEWFCRRYSGPLLSAVRLRFGCARETAEEIVHLTFIRSVRFIHTFDPARGRLFAWLSGIARNEAVRVLPTSPAVMTHLDDSEREFVERIDETELPDEHLCRQEFRALVLDSLMDLSSRHREVLVMKYLENRRVADMAATLGQSEKAVESLLTRSRLALKEHLSKRLKEPARTGGDSL